MRKQALYKDHDKRVGTKSFPMKGGTALAERGSLSTPLSFFRLPRFARHIVLDAGHLTW